MLRCLEIGCLRVDSTHFRAHAASAHAADYLLSRQPRPRRHDFHNGPRVGGALRRSRHHLRPRTTDQPVDWHVAEAFWAETMKRADLHSALAAGLARPHRGRRAPWKDETILPSASRMAWDAAGDFPQGVQGARGFVRRPPHAEDRLILLAISEWQVQFPARPTASPSDVELSSETAARSWYLYGRREGSRAVRRTVADWRAKPTPGKDRRLASLRTLLGLSTVMG